MLKYIDNTNRLLFWNQFLVNANVFFQEQEIKNQFEKIGNNSPIVFKKKKSKEMWKTILEKFFPHFYQRSIFSIDFFFLIHYTQTKYTRKFPDKDLLNTSVTDSNHKMMKWHKRKPLIFKFNLKNKIIHGNQLIFFHTWYFVNDGSWVIIIQNDCCFELALKHTRHSKICLANKSL